MSVENGLCLAFSLRADSASCKNKHNRGCVRTFIYFMWVFFNEITPSLHLLITSRKSRLKLWLLNVRCSEMTERISAHPWNKEVSEFSVPSSCIWHIKDCTGFNSFLVDVAALFLQPRVFIWAPLLPPRSQPLLLPSRDRGAAATFPPAEPAFLAVRLRLLNYYL